MCWCAVKNLHTHTPHVKARFEPKFSVPSKINFKGHRYRHSTTLWYLDSQNAGDMGILCSANCGESCVSCVHSWLIYCPIVCVMDICFTASYVAKNVSVMRVIDWHVAKDKPKSTEMPVILCVWQLQSLWNRMLKCCCFLHTIFDWLQILITWQMRRLH